GWNRHHEAAVEALGDARDLVAHVELESYSVLTRLPEPFRAQPALVAEHLRRDYPGGRMVLVEAERRELAGRLAQLSIAGGAVYDAMVATTAASCGYRLLSCDRRAASTYERLGVEVAYL
ncbi:MAG: type II toxin-antitoxin system VapC family toxin, partial [Solirubrobacteraceae bacterium]